MKLLLSYCICFLIFTFSGSPVFSSEILSENSAHYKKAGNTSLYLNQDYKVKSLITYLTVVGSPLVPFVHDLISASDMYGLDWRLMAAIAGVESGFCKKFPRNSYNCWGWNNGKYNFPDYPGAIYSISRALRINYIDRGYVSIEQIGTVYAPPSSTWASKVRFFMNSMNATIEELSLLQITI